MPEQVCPVCCGRGNVSRGFYNPHPHQTHNTTAPETCRRCGGLGTIHVTPHTPPINFHYPLFAANTNTSEKS